MRPFAWLLLVLFLLPRPALAYVDVSSTLGDVIKEANAITVLKVEKVSQAKRAIIFKKVADLKGKSPEDVRHELAEGFHPREPKIVLDWAEPGKIALCFTTGRASVTCIGDYWYECGALEAPWWTMTSGRPELALAYFGTAEKLRDAIPPILDGKEVVVTAINHGSHSGVFQYNNVAFKKVLRGKDCPVWRIKASLEMPSSTWEIGVKDSKWVIGPGFAGPEDVPSLVRDLEDKDRNRLRAADELGLVGWGARSALPALRQAMKDADPMLRISAARAITFIGEDDPAALRALQEALKDKSPTTRKAAAVALGDIGADARGAVPALRAALRDEDNGVRWSVAEALGHIGPGAEDAVADLAEALRDPAIRVMAADALGGIGRASRGAVPLLTDALKDRDNEFRWTAAIALTRIDTKAARAALPLFIEKLNSPDIRTRWDSLMYITPMGAEARDAVPALRAWVKRGNGVAAASLANIIGPEAADDALRILLGVLADDWDTSEDIAKIGPAAVPGLVEILDSNDAPNRHLAVKTLGLLAAKTDKACPILVKTLKDSDPAIRKAAAAALGGIESKPKAVAPALAEALKDDVPAVRLAAAAALRGCTTEEGAKALPALVELLTHKEPNVRRDAAVALAEFGSDGKPALPDLRRAMKDPEPGVSSAASWAVARVRAAADNREAVSALVAALQAKEPRDRQDAARLLGKLGPDARDAVAALVLARQDADEDVRRAATEALARIQAR